jgi:sigma-B regulation protein RsbU (phosphoserine phosphatase)
VLAADMEGNRFVTMLLACLHGPTGSFTYASAGHGGYVLDGSGAIKTDRHGIAARTVCGSRVRDERPDHPRPAEMMLLLADGVMDSEAPDQAPFGVERILDVVRSCRGERAREVVAKLCREARAFQHGAPQQDDITIVVCTADASANAA